MDIEEQVDRENMIEAIQDLCPGEIDYLNMELEDRGYDTLSEKEANDLMVVFYTDKLPDEHRQDFSKMTIPQLTEFADLQLKKGHEAVVRFILRYLNESRHPIRAMLEQFGHNGNGFDLAEESC